MSTHNQRLGRAGEQAAARFLEEKGFTILGRNLHTPHGEIDLLAEKADVLVFVEVKTRRNKRYGLPEEAVTPAKLAHMHDAAQFILSDNPESYANRPLQFDVIALLPGPTGDFEITHYVDVRI